MVENYSQESFDKFSQNFTISCSKFSKAFLYNRTLLTKFSEIPSTSFSHLKFQINTLRSVNFTFEAYLCVGFLATSKAKGRISDQKGLFFASLIAAEHRKKKMLLEMCARFAKVSLEKLRNNNFFLICYLCNRPILVLNIFIYVQTICSQLTAQQQGEREEASHIKSGKAFTYWRRDARVNGRYWFWVLIESVWRAVVPPIYAISQIIFCRRQCVVLREK